MEFSSWSARPVLVLDGSHNHGRLLEQAAIAKIKRALLAAGLHPTFNEKEALLRAPMNAPTRRKAAKAVKAWNAAQAAFPK